MSKCRSAEIVILWRNKAGAMIGRLLATGVALGLLLWCNVALADQPPTQPLLRLETGMHMAQIQGISVDARRQTLLTVSYDKTARLWSLGDGKLIRVLRPPIGGGNEGRLDSGALSPYGRIAAVGGWTGYEWNGSHSVYLFDTSSGKLVRQLAGLPDTVESLAFSPDGEVLAAGLATNGVRVWRTGDWSAAWSDTEYGERVYGLAFTKSDELVASSLDGYLRSYDVRGKLRQPKVKAPGGTHPIDVAVSTDGERVAVVYYDTVRVDLVA